MLTLKWFLPEKKQQSERLFCQLSERDIDFMMRQSNQDEQLESRGNRVCIGTFSDNVSNPTQVNYPKVDVHTLGENIVSEVENELDNMLTSVRNRVQGAVLAAIESLVIPKVDLAKKSANAPSERSVDGNVLESEHMDFQGNIQSL